MRVSINSIIVSIILIVSTRVDANSCMVKTKPGSYSYDVAYGIGPDKWDTLDGYQECGKGKAQSPIDFTLNQIVNRPLSEAPESNMKLAMMNFSLAVENWALNCKHKAFNTCGFTKYGGKFFNFVNFHFHSPSEHKLSGKQYPLEGHMVHQATDGQLLVIATMFDYPQPESFSSMVHTGNPKNNGTNKFVSEVMNGVMNDMSQFSIKFGQIIEPSEGFCSYMGSLTTPPCSENVIFFMQLGVQTVTKSQVHQYSVSVGKGEYGNNRPEQPLNGRTITCFT